MLLTGRISLSFTSLGIPYKNPAIKSTPKTTRIEDGHNLMRTGKGDCEKLHFWNFGFVDQISFLGLFHDTLFCQVLWFLAPQGMVFSLTKS